MQKVLLLSKQLFKFVVALEKEEEEEKRKIEMKKKKACRQTLKKNVHDRTVIIYLLRLLLCITMLIQKVSRF